MAALDRHEAAFRYQRDLGALPVGIGVPVRWSEREPMTVAMMPSGNRMLLYGIAGFVLACAACAVAASPGS